MGKTLIKICGLQDVEVLKSMIHLPVHYIGLVFAPSKRRVSPEQARKLLSVLDKQDSGRPHAVGVFVNPAMEELALTLRDAPLDVIQLHGTESPVRCGVVKRRFPGVRVWKALAAMPGGACTSDGAYRAADYAAAVDALLLDTYDASRQGGSGRAFDWSTVPAVQQAARAMGVPLFVAGGLHEGNVDQLIRNYSPDGVDVSSGVETAGLKDMLKISAFVERVGQS